MANVKTNQNVQNVRKKLLLTNATKLVTKTELDMLLVMEKKDTSALRSVKNN
jgi:hypothetical protein